MDTERLSQTIGNEMQASQDTVFVSAHSIDAPMALPLASKPADAADNTSAPIIPELDFIVFSFSAGDHPIRSTEEYLPKTP